MSKTEYKGSRHATREALVKYLYAIEFQEESAEKFLDTYEGAHANDINRDFFSKLLKGVEEHKEELDKIIEEHSENWNMDRIAKIDLAILRIALFEMLHMKDIPESVSINEAVELAKTYSHDDAGAYINGILGSVQKKK